MADKVFIKAYCKTGKYGIKISGKVDEIIEQLRANANSRGYINLELKEKKTPNDKGTHYLEVDTWEPNGQGGPVHYNQNAMQNSSVGGNNQPF